MKSLVVRICCCVLLVICLQQVLVAPAVAGTDDARIQELKAKMLKLQELLTQVQEEKLREQPPTERPWQPILAAGEELQGYYQYAYLLAPQMPAATLDSVMQQLNYVSEQDEMKERGVVFIIPALPLADGESMEVSKYNRDMATTFLRQVRLPAAIEGGLLISSTPIGGAGIKHMLFIDLTGCDQILRSRIFELLQKYHVFTEKGSTHGYVWELLQQVAPQAFTVYMHNDVAWLALAK